MIRDTSLLYFYEVANRGSIRKAAEHLYVSPSAISRMIKKAEREFRAELFERGVKGMRLTPAGWILKEQLKGVMEQMRDAHVRIDELKSLRRGDVKIYCIEGIVQTLLPRIIASFHQRYPEIRFSVHTGSSDAIVKALLDDQVDLGILFNMSKRPGIEVLATYTHTLQAMVAPGHPLASGPRPTLRKVAQYPIAMPDTSFGVRNLLDRALQARGMDVQMLVTTNSLALTRAVAQVSDVVTLTPAFAAVEELEAGYLVAVPLARRDVISGATTICQRRYRRLSLAALEFKDYFLEQYSLLELRANSKVAVR